MYNLLFATTRGEVFDYPAMDMVGRWGDRWVEPEPAEMIPLPPGATLAMVPHRLPVGIERRTGKFQPLRHNPYGSGSEPAWAVGALLPQGYTRTLLPAFAPPRGDEAALPLLGYTAVGVKDGRYFVAALPTDEDDRWNPHHYHTPELEQKVKERLAAHAGNRILRQLGRCSLEYGCFTAQNIFYRRWEGGLPCSPACNARCLGCISRQPAECCPSPQERISFRPSVQEMLEVALPHLEGAQAAIISCGQGCEGEPLLRAGEIAQVIREVRKATGRGTFNINTNAGHTAGIRLVCQAGVDSLRVSLNSANPEVYHAYYRPRGYTLDDVRSSLRLAASCGVYTSLNLLAFPGVTDREEEAEALFRLVREAGIKMIQVRNLNIDPDFYLRAVPPARGEIMGVPAWLELLAGELPGVTTGNYSRPVR